MTDAGQLQLDTRAVVALTGVLLLGFAASLGMAFNIDAIALSFGVSNAQAGMVASAEMVAIAGGTLYFARAGSAFNPHQLYRLALLLVIACNTLSVMVPSAQWLLGVRVPAGLAIGAVMATVMATAGRSDKPQQTFGMINAAVGVMGVMVAYILPRALRLGELLPESWQLSPVDGLYAVYALAGLLAYLFVSATPRPKPYIAADGKPAQVPMRGWIALLGLGVLFFGHGLLGIFLVRIGRQATLDAQAIGYVFMVGGFIGIVAPLVAGYLGARFSALLLSALIIGFMLLLAGVLAGAREPMTFIITAPLFAVLPTALMPIFLGATAVVEPSGRLTGSHPAFVMLGGALAPLAGGLLSDSQGFTANGMAAMVCIVVGAALMLPVLRAADVGRRRQPSLA